METNMKANRIADDHNDLGPCNPCADESCAICYPELAATWPESQVGGDKATVTITEDSFREMCRRHDLTFDYSDDGSVWRRGCASWDAVTQAAKLLPRDVAVRIWNEIVDTKLVEDARESFYWK